jgi:organic hydroperoxide reductase OsmC/OhrA
VDIRARVRSGGHGHAVQVRADGRAQPLAVPGRPGGAGSAVNGGELLCLALATCSCNDLSRGAARRGLTLRGVEAVAEGGGPGEPARRITCSARAESDAPGAEVEALLRHTDAVAEVHNTLRGGIAVERRSP